MRAGTDRNVRRMIWLIIVIGLATTIVALVYPLLSLGPGITLPFTRSALDVGWLLVFGLLWLVVGLLLLLWYRSGSVEPDAIAKLEQLEKRLAAFEAAQDTRLADLGTHLEKLRTQLNGRDGSNTHPVDLNHELGSLATGIQDAHTRLDKLGDVNARLHDLASQLDSLYVMLQDIHRRLDSIEERHPQ